MTYKKYGWCSWCHQKTHHNLIEKNKITRNEYQCTSCGNYTITCRYCDNMATYKPAQSESQKFYDSLKENWASELCAEHDGSIADFDKLNYKLDDLENYKIIFKRSKLNLAKGAKISGGVIAGTAVFAPVALLAAPGVASAIGATGVLGAAGTGTAISSLSGAALTSASLAALGPAGVAGGVAVVTATGAALGGARGAVISNNYFGAIKDFNIKKIKNGIGSPAIFINGFLSQKNQDFTDWTRTVSKKFPEIPYYSINWESSSLYKMGGLIGQKGTEEAFKKYILKLIARAGKRLGKRINPLTWAKLVADIVGNPWHSSMLKAQMTGVLLADLISRTDNDEGYTLMGHSLGARVIYYLLNSLSTKDTKFIKDVYLLGGAVDKTDEQGWMQAASSVSGKIYNCYSSNDSVLNFLYNGANAFQSKPVGLGEIEYESTKIINYDASHIIGGHMQYKEKFDRILTAL